MCGRTADSYLAHESKLDCSETFVPGNSEFSLYTALCFGCDPNLQYFGDEYNRTGRAFSESRGPLTNLERVPSKKSLVKMILPKIDGAKCRDDKAYLSAHYEECKDLKYLAEALYGKDDGSVTAAYASEEKLRQANDDANDAVVKAIKSKGGSKYQTTCNSANASVGVVRGEHFGNLKKSKDAVWANVIAEIGMKRGCIRHYISEAPAHWCGAGDKGENVNEAACLTKLAANPAEVLSKFKTYATDPSVRAPQVVKSVGSGTKPPANSGTGDGWSNLSAKDRAIAEEQRRGASAIPKIIEKKTSGAE